MKAFVLLVNQFRMPRKVKPIFCLLCQKTVKNNFLECFSAILVAITRKNTTFASYKKYERAGVFRIGTAR